MAEEIEKTPPVICDGLHHEWTLLPYQEGEPSRAVAKCCGVRAVHRGGAWVIVEGE